MKLEDYSKYYIQGSDHYLIPKDIFIELFEEMINWKQENQQLKEEFDRMFAIYHSRKLIKKFNDEYDEEVNAKEFLELVKEKQKEENKHNFEHCKNINGYRFSDSDFS